MNKSCNIDITHVISDQVSGNLTIVKSILHDQSSHVISKLCRIASTCQLSCNVDITPYRINIKSHNFAMFSPATAAAILNCRNQNRGQEPSSSVTSTRGTSPLYCPVEQLNPGGAGVLTPTRHPLQPANCPLVQSTGKHLLGHTTC